MRIGEFQSLKVVRESPHGLFLNDGENDILLPNRQCPDDAFVGHSLRVFVYTDSEDRPIATSMKPYAAVGQFAKMRVVSVTQAGAFLDWGLDKDLFCPLREQQHRLEEGRDCIVRVYLDETSQRVVGTTRLHRFLKSEGEGMEPGKAVKILAIEKNKNFITVIIDDQVKGAMFPDEWHESLGFGDIRDGYIKRIRPDGKVAVSLRPQSYQAVMGSSNVVLQALRDSGGVLPVSDKSSPEEIHRRFGLSKAAFKKLIGTLYREGQIEIEPQSIRLK